MSPRRKVYAPLPPYADERRFADACCAELDSSKESSHTADQADFCVVGAQTSGFGGGGRKIIPDCSIPDPELE
jgi:hypothetical protein